MHRSTDPSKLFLNVQKGSRPYTCRHLGFVPDGGRRTWKRRVGITVECGPRTCLSQVRTLWKGEPDFPRPGPRVGQAPSAGPGLGYAKSPGTRLPPCSSQAHPRPTWTEESGLLRTEGTLPTPPTPDLSRGKDLGTPAKKIVVSPQEYRTHSGRRPLERKDRVVSTETGRNREMK